MNEYGGCLNFELINNTYKNTAYYDTYDKNKVDVDSGRSAIQFILQNFNFKRIWLPVYNCPLVEKRIIETTDVKIVWYNINSDFEPIVEHSSFSDGDALLWVNYCGVMSQQLVDKVADLQNVTPVKIIIDNIPAYFSLPRLDVLNIYSCRKFIGVPDGGHIIGNGIKKVQLPVYSTASNYTYLLKAIEDGSNSAYDDYQKSEKRFAESKTAYGMPILTQYILKCINYDTIIEDRRRNFRVLHAILGDTNRFKFTNDNTIIPSYYPYLCSDKQLREKLLDNKIYISRFWKHVLTNERANDFEKDLAEFLIPLPIDQRYNSDDMEYIAKKIKMMENKNE